MTRLPRLACLTVLLLGAGNAMAQIGGTIQPAPDPSPPPVATQPPPPDQPPPPPSSWNGTSQQALETAKSGTVVPWKNPDGTGGSITPMPAFQNSSGQVCREFQETVTIGGQPQQAYGTACRQPDGSWQLQRAPSQAATATPAAPVPPPPPTVVYAMPPAYYYPAPYYYSSSIFLGFGFHDHDRGHHHHH